MNLALDSPLLMCVRFCSKVFLACLACSALPLSCFASPCLALSTLFCLAPLCLALPYLALDHAYPALAMPAMCAFGYLW